MARYRAATDVGGTFTDLVAFETTADGTLRVVTAKADTTPPDFERGVLDVLAKGGLSPAEIGFLAHGTTVVINALTERKGVKVGLITTKVGTLETKDAIRRRIDEATKYTSLDQLCLSPQCGFASTEEGNTLAEDEQWAKLRMVIEIAREVWGDK